MNQVWNQAIYLYRAYYREHPQALQTDAEERRAQDMQVNLTVFWNEDYQPTYGPGKATAAVDDRGGGVFTVTPATSTGAASLSGGRCCSDCSSAAAGD